MTLTITAAAVPCLGSRGRHEPLVALLGRVDRHCRSDARCRRAGHAHRRHSRPCRCCTRFTVRHRRTVSTSTTSRQETTAPYLAGTGYDLDLGIGTPIANNLVPALAGEGPGVPPGPLRL